MQAGDITKYEYYITKGCLKVYTLDEDGAPHISMFAVEDYWTGDMASFMTRETLSVFHQSYRGFRIVRYFKDQLRFTFSGDSKI